MLTQPNRHSGETRGKRRSRQRAWARLERRVRASRPGVNDRGTVLLMVLGVLALMAIIAVVYASVGKADRSTSAAMVRTQRIEEQVDQIARYIADVIGRDVFATYAQEDYRQRVGGDFTPPAPRLEAYDAPETDVMMVSQRDADDGQWQTRQRDGFYLFNAEGSVAQAWRSIANPTGNGAPATRRDPRSPSDPYLAATEPSFVNRASLDWSWQTFSEREDYLNKRDWAHITNLNPSGNFVNLWALRNNFRAEPGFEADQAGRSRLSSHLTLINPATGLSFPAPNSGQDPDDDIGGVMRLGNLTGRARLNRPADWTRDQIGAFRSTAEPANGPYTVDDPEFMPYQWADADGDGFYDARWGELVDISDPDNSRPVITANGRVRLFYAARVVDLTGLVNVNTAANFQFEPKRYYANHQGRNGVGVFDPVSPVTRPGDENTVQPPSPLAGNWADYRNSVEQSFQVPAGLTPADVDLQRLLRMSDAFYAYSLGGNGVGYDDLPQPRDGADAPGDYRDYDPNNNRRNEVIGNAAFQALDIARLGDLPIDLRFTDPDNAPGPGAQPYIQSLKVAASRFAYYDGYGTRPEPGRKGGTGLLNRYGRPFGDADELELRTFQGLNDPSRTSRLESVLAGRYDGDPDTYTLSPLRDNRPDQLERAGRDLAQPANLANTRPGDDDEYRKALLAAEIDVRRMITTINGARPIIDPVLVTTYDPTSHTLSEDAGTIRVDGSRLVSRLVETGNYSFHRGTGAAAGVAPTDPCDPQVRTRVAPLKEDLWDAYGWFTDDTDAGREFFYRALDNLPLSGARPPLPPRPIPAPAEWYETSRLDLMREAFRAYLDGLLPYSQWGSDPRQSGRLDGPFPNAWDVSDVTSANLAYGGNAELAYRMAAHMAANLRDALDVDRRSRTDAVLIQDDNLQTAVTLDLTPDAMLRSSLGTYNPLNPPTPTIPAWAAYQRDRFFPWPKLNPDNRLSAADDRAAQTRLTPNPSLVRSVRGTDASGATFSATGPVKRVNIFGVEAQPFIAQVTAMSAYVDTPPSSFTPDSDDEAAAQQLPTIPGQQPPPPPPITIDVRRDIGSADNPVGNPDFLFTVLAFQLTNPFETDIELEPAQPSNTDSWYYIEYANRYYRLVPQDDTTTDGLPASVPDAKRILRAGETRVFYATYPNSIEEISDRVQRAQAALAQRLGGTSPTADPDFFERFAKHEFGDNCVHVAPMYPETGIPIGNLGTGQGLANIDLFAIPREFVSNNLADVSGGSNGAAQPSFGPDDANLSDNRRVVYLWRVLRDPDSQDGGTNDLAGLPAGANWTGNDLMLDRLRDPSARAQNPDGVLIKAVIDAFGSGNSNTEVPGTEAGIDEVGRNALDNTGFSLISWQSIVRPTNPRRDHSAGGTNFDGRVGTDPDGKSPIGAMPPWTLEAKPDNVYTPGFEQQVRTNRSWSLNRARGVTGIGREGRYGDPALPYYKELNDLVGKHLSTTTRDSSRQPLPMNYPNAPSPSDAKYVDRDLSVQFAELRGGKAYPRSGSNATDPREQFSIVDIDEERAAPGKETQWFAGRPRRFDEVAVEIHRLPPDRTGSGESQSTQSRALFSRVGDFLLPLAIGPWHDPSVQLSGSPSRAELLDAQWTTLSEVLALACDYYSAPQFLDAAQGSTGTRPNIFFRFGHDNRNDPRRTEPQVTIPKAVRGQLVLDAYAPYLDYDNAPAYRWSQLDPGNNASLRDTRDAPLGHGIPLALNILDKFRVAGLPAETQARLSDPRRCPTDPTNPSIDTPRVGERFSVTGRSQAYGSATQAEPGRININTAPLAVLRLLPLVAPSPDTLNPTSQTLFDSWLFDGRFTNDQNALVTPYDVPDTLAAANPPVPATAATRLWDPSSTAPNQATYDVAASWVAYRDLGAMKTRSFAGQPSILVNFRNDREGLGDLSFARSGRDDAMQINIEDPRQGGLRDQRGFKSVGEIMAVDIRRSTDPDVVRRGGYPAPLAPDTENSTTRLARDGASNRSVGIDSSAYKVDRARTVFGDTPGTDSAPAVPMAGSNTLYDRRIVPDGADTIPDDYDEKLSIANAVLNTLTVRSDFFCVWFVVNGYTPEDVQVDDGFPMVPSVARRYVMVVDRTNVTSPTTKPRIVMFREVPMP